MVPGALVDWATVLTSALDEVGYGTVLLDKDRAQFINRAFHRMWAQPPPPPGINYQFADQMMEHGRKTGAYEVAPEAMGDYVRKRIALVRAGSQPPVQLRLTDVEGAGWAEVRDKSDLSFGPRVEHCGLIVENVRHNLAVVWDA